MDLPPNHQFCVCRDLNCSPLFAIFLFFSFSCFKYCSANYLLVLYYKDYCWNFRRISSCVKMQSLTWFATFRFFFQFLFLVFQNSVPQFISVYAAIRITCGTSANSAFLCEYRASHCPPLFAIVCIVIFLT